MRPMRGALPSPSTCFTEYLSAMEGWNSEQAERAAVSIARSGSAAEGFRHLWRYGARDYRNIGHKAIFVANAERTLRTIGWKMNGYALVDQTYAANSKRVIHSLARLENAWGAKADASITKRIVEDIRTATPDEACAAVTERLVKGATGTAETRPDSTRPYDVTARQAFLSTAVRFTLARAEEVHYYKYLAALMEDIPLVSAEWRPHLTTAVLYYTKGSKDPEPEWAKKAKEA